MMKKILCIVLALMMVLSLAACGGAKTEAPKTEEPKTEAPKTEAPKTEAPKAEEPKAEAPKAEEPKAEEPKAPTYADLKYDGPAQDFVVNFTSAEQQNPIYIAAFNRITEKTDGKITFTFYYSGSLMDAASTMDGLGAGMADFSDVTLTNFKDQFPYTQQVLSYPFMGFTSMAMAADVIQDTVHANDLMMKEFTDVNIYPIIFNAVWGTTMALAEDVQVGTPDTVKGLKLGTDDPNLSKFLNSIGATPTFVIPPDYYSSITSGVVDGVINGMNVINIFGGLQPSKHVYMFENSASTSARCIAANLDTWNGLDDTLKAIFTEELTGDQYWKESVDYWTVSDQKHLDDAKGWGIPVDYITGDAMQAWVDGVRPYGDEMLQALRDRGCDKTDEVLKIWEDAIANYSGRFA